MGQIGKRQLFRGLPATIGVRDPEVRRVLDAVVENLRYYVNAVQTPGTPIPQETSQGPVTLLPGAGIKIDPITNGYRITCTVIDTVGGGSGILPREASMSIRLNGNNLLLVNDSYSPGASKVYGTDASGVKGWKDDPAPGVKDSVVIDAEDDDKLKLSGDAASPGNSKVYGTDADGVKGWQNEPTKTSVSSNDTTPGQLEDKIVGDSNWIEKTTLNDGSDEDVKVAHIGPHSPTSTQTVGSASEGSEAAETTTFTVGTDGKGMVLYVMSRAAYFDAGDEKIYGYVRALTVDEKGHIVSIGAETRYEIDVPVAES